LLRNIQQSAHVAPSAASRVRAAVAGPRHGATPAHSAGIDAAVAGTPLDSRDAIAAAPFAGVPALKAPHSQNVQRHPRQPRTSRARHQRSRPGRHPRRQRKQPPAADIYRAAGLGNLVGGQASAAAKVIAVATSRHMCRRLACAGAAAAQRTDVAVRAGGGGVDSSCALRRQNKRGRRATWHAEQLPSRGNYAWELHPHRLHPRPLPQPGAHRQRRRSVRRCQAAAPVELRSCPSRMPQAAA
jgi:hypothetical protein